jgi:hypothetical protein
MTLPIRFAHSQWFSVFALPSTTVFLSTFSSGHLGTTALLLLPSSSIKMAILPPPSSIQNFFPKEGNTPPFAFSNFSSKESNTPPFAFSNFFFQKKVILPPLLF